MSTVKILERSESHQETYPRVCAGRCGETADYVIKVYDGDGACVADVFSCFEHLPRNQWDAESSVS